MLIKTTRASWHQSMLHGERPVSLMKCASSGLGSGGDFRALVKRAGHYVADMVRGIKFASGEVPVHSIALGAEEWYGPNRNGDGFSEAACRKYHKTFEKYARAYRDHENKDPAKSYGIVKLAIYNEPMHRIELILAYNATKEAALRNGGLVADKELDLLEKGADFDTSMACRVPFDVCSVCNNRAKTRADYCTSIKEGGMCKGGGLKNNIATILGDGTQVFAHNPDPCWFDNSMVWRHADRIASATGMLKAAGDRRIGGAEMAELMGVTAPWSVILLDAGPATELAVKLAGIEKRVENGHFRDSLNLGMFGDETDQWTKHGGTIPQALSALASQKVVMPVEGFVQLVTGREWSQEKIAAVKSRLPGVYSRMIEDGSIDKLASENPYTITNDVPPLRVRQWAERLATGHAFTRQGLTKRALAQGIYRSAPEVRTPAASESTVAAEELARSFAMYKLAFLQTVLVKDSEIELTCAAVVRQNYL